MTLRNAGDDPLALDCITLTSIDAACGIATPGLYPVAVAALGRLVRSRLP